MSAIGTTIENMKRSSSSSWRLPEKVGIKKVNGFDIFTYTRGGISPKQEFKGISSFLEKVKYLSEEENQK